MTQSRILIASSYYLLPVLCIFSLYLLFKGHHEPGGGFVGGLTASSGLALFAIVNGRRSLDKVLPFGTTSVIVSGLAVMVFAGLVGILSGEEFLAEVKLGISFPVIGEPGTAFLFDTGVYLVVIGAVVKIVLALIEE